jgi:hypothetical protein
MEMKEKEIGEFKIVELCLNDIIIGIATDIGPRILYAADKNKPDFNLFGIVPELGEETPNGFWRMYGGHRLWVSPEEMPRTYSMDNKPVKIEEGKNGSVVIHGNPEKENSVQKQIEIKPYSKGGVEVIHKINNIGKHTITFANWALSVMREKGFTVIPFNAGQRGFLPDRRLSIWPYTKFSDERLILDQDEYIFVQQDPIAKEPIKIGTIAHPSWLAYCVSGKAFGKTFSREEGKYPDFGCNIEVYTSAEFLEMETLSPLKTVKPSGSISHTEVWNIYDVGAVKPTFKSVENKLAGLIKY